MTTQTWDIPALLQFHRSTFGDLRMEAGEAAGVGGPSAPPSSPPQTFTQADVDRVVSERLTRERAKYSDYDDLKAKATEADRLRQELESESERATREAVAAATASERQRLAPVLVAAKFEAAAKGVLTVEQRDALLEDLDLTKYLTDKGEVDVAKVENKVAAFAPKNDPTRRRLPDLGQGKRSTSKKASVGAAKEEYLESRRKRR